jgi:hypothetical protein
VQGQPASLPGGTTAVGTTNGIIILSRAETSAGIP